jgi:hypothetical protein
MTKTSVVPKKKRGPAPTGKGTQIQVRLQPAQLGALDAYIAKQNAPHSRPEAIRAILDLVLHVHSKDTKADKRRPTLTDKAKGKSISSPRP